jgi:hypothetical protein
MYNDEKLKNHRQPSLNEFYLCFSLVIEIAQDVVRVVCVLNLSGTASPHHLKHMAHVS